MPKYAEFVIAAYGLSVAVLGIYAFSLMRRTSAARKALEILERSGKPSA